jgi:DNA-binding beta-propeller fold protein YncE
MLKFFAAGGAALALAGCGARGFSGLTTFPSVPQLVAGANAGDSYASAFQLQPNGRVKLDVPIGLAVNKHGDLCVGNAGESNILVYNSKRRPVKSATITKGIKDPAGLAFDKHGDLYVANVISKEVTVYSRKGKRIRDKTIKLHMGVDLEPSGIAIAKNGDVWVAGRDGHDYSLGEIDVFNSSHKLIIA